MDTIPLPPDGTAKQLSLLVSRRLKFSTLAFLWVICREPGTLKITDVPSTVFDQSVGSDPPRFSLESPIQMVDTSPKHALESPRRDSEFHWVAHPGYCSSDVSRPRRPGYLPWRIYLRCGVLIAHCFSVKTLPRNNVRKDGDQQVLKSFIGPLAGCVYECRSHRPSRCSNREGFCGYLARSRSLAINWCVCSI